MGLGTLHYVRELTREEFNVSITSDGRRLDSKEAVIAFFAELEAEAAAAAE
jgi:hypothetical protein